MAKEWVQISDSQAKIFEASYTRKFYHIQQIIIPITMGLICFIVCFIVTHFLISNFSIIFSQPSLVYSEPIPETTREKLETVISIIISIIISIAISFLLVAMPIWLAYKIKDEFIFDLDKKTVSHIVRSNFSRLLKRQGSVRIYSLYNRSKVAVSIDSDKDRDDDDCFFYSLEIIGDYSGKNLRIDRSDSYLSLASLARLASSKDINRLQNLAHQIGDFLGVPVEIDPSIIKQEKLATGRPIEKLSLPETETIESAVEKIYKTLISGFGQVQEYCSVNSEDFRGYVDLAYYHRLQSALVDQGYIWAGDIENITLLPDLEEYNMRTFIRAMINPTHNTSIAIYHFRPRIFLGFLMQQKVFECETEFSPEKYLLTTNASKTPFDYPPGFDAVHLPSKTSYKTVLKTHYQRLQRAMSNWGLSPTPLHNLDDVIAMQTRMQQAKMTYRKQIGYITDRELSRFQVDPQIAREVGRRLKEKFNSRS